MQDTNSLRTLALMILFGITRAGLAWLGGWLNAHGVSDEGMLSFLLNDETAKNVSAALLSLLPVAWTVAQKLQVMGWLKTKIQKAMRVEVASLAAMEEEPTPAEIITASPGPNFPV